MYWNDLKLFLKLMKRNSMHFLVAITALSLFILCLFFFTEREKEGNESYVSSFILDMESPLTFLFWLWATIKTRNDPHFERFLKLGWFMYNGLIITETKENIKQKRKSGIIVVAIMNKLCPTFHNCIKNYFVYCFV